MIRNIFILIFSFHILYAADIVNLSDFDTRQTILQDVKKVVQDEESIARAYEQYILDNYDIPSSINLLYTTDYLGTSANFLGVITGFSTNFNTFSLGLSKISYGLQDILKADEGIKDLYESNTFRERTYYRDNKIHFILEDAFAKHLFNLIQETSSGLSTCAGSPGVNCIKDNHIYIKPTYASLVITDYLMVYHIDNFKTGPIVIKDASLYTTNPEFKSIPRGALIIDTKGLRYVKTTSSIEALQ